MANVKISQLTEKTNPDGWEELLFAEGGNNWKISLNKVKEFSQPTIDSEMSDESENAVQNKVVKAYVDSKSFDEEWYYPKLHSWSTDQIYTEENTVSVWEWNFRTTAWDVSVPSSWEWTLNYIRWNMVRSSWTDTLADIRITTSEWLWITDFKKYTYLYQTSNQQTSVTFTCTEWTWDSDPNNYWVYYAFDDWISDWTITVETVTAEDRADLLVAKPKYLFYTWVNQAGDPIVWQIDNYWIVDWRIAQKEWYYITYVWAAGWVTNWYMAQDNFNRISSIWVVNKPFTEVVTENDIVDQTWAHIDSAESWMSFDNNCWFVVESTGASFNDGNSSILPRWSNQRQYDFSNAEINYLELPAVDENRSQLSYWTNWLLRIGDVYDELDFSSKTYIKRIDVWEMNYSTLQQLQDEWKVFEYDNNHIYSVMSAEERVKTQDFDNHYTANDYWTEFLWDWTFNWEQREWSIISVKVEASTSYWTNLVDKLRTGVATKDQLPQVMFQWEYENIGEQKNSDWIVRFIYTCDKPESFEVEYYTFDSSSIWESMYATVAYDLSPAGYPFDISIQSSDSNVISIDSGPTIVWSTIACIITLNGVWTADISVTVWWVTKTQTWEIYSWE